MLNNIYGICNFIPGFKDSGIFFMLTAKQIKFISSLHQKKFREEYNCFIAEGQKIVGEILDSEYRVQGIYATREWIQNHQHEATNNIPVFETLPREMQRISSLTTPSPVLAVVRIPDYAKKDVTDLTSNPDPPGSSDSIKSEPFTTSADRSVNPLILALDDIRDPGNMGTIIRIADWFGVGIILCSMNCVDEFNPKVVQATMGSIARVRVVRCDLEKILAKISDQNKVSLSSPHLAPDEDSNIPLIPVYGACLDGENIYSSENLQGFGILLIGNESHGISEDLLPLITHKITIPTFHSDVVKRAESLNASVATAIILAEFFRRFGFNPVEKQTL